MTSLTDQWTIWLGTEGLDLSPVLCTGGEAGTRLCSELSEHRVVSTAALVPCCNRSNTVACARDLWSDTIDNTTPELDQAVRTIRATAERLGIVWPEDSGALP